MKRVDRWMRGWQGFKSQRVINEEYETSIENCLCPDQSFRMEEICRHRRQVWFETQDIQIKELANAD